MKHGFQIYFELLEQARGEDTSLPALQRKWLTTSVRSYAHHTGRVPLVFDFIKWNGKGKIPGPASWRHPWAGSCRGLVRKGRRRPAGGKAQCWGLLGGRWGGGRRGGPHSPSASAKGGRVPMWESGSCSDRPGRKKDSFQNCSQGGKKSPQPSANVNIQQELRGPTLRGRGGLCTPDN